MKYLTESYRGKHSKQRELEENEKQLGVTERRTMEKYLSEVVYYLQLLFWLGVVCGLLLLGVTLRVFIR